jgi:anti-anti-sigma factor
LLYLSGELDRNSAGELREVIQQELAANARGLLLECTELAYIDSGGISLVFGTVQSLKAGGLLGIVAPNVGVHKIIEMTGLLDRPEVRLYANLAAAKTDLVAVQG